MVTVDVVMMRLRQRDLQVLLVKRRSWPYESMWAIPGGFVNIDESLEAAAKSHCVLESARQLVGHFANRPELLSRLNILKDCTSSVRHPTVDFDALAEEELAAMKQMGVNLVLSTDPVV